MTATLIRPEPMSSPIVVFFLPNSAMAGSVGDMARPAKVRDGATVHGGNCVVLRRCEKGLAEGTTLQRQQPNEREELRRAQRVCIRCFRYCTFYRVSVTAHTVTSSHQTRTI